MPKLNELASITVSDLSALPREDTPRPFRRMTAEQLRSLLAGRGILSVDEAATLTKRQLLEVIETSKAPAPAQRKRVRRVEIAQPNYRKMDTDELREMARNRSLGTPLQVRGATHEQLVTALTDNRELTTPKRRIRKADAATTQTPKYGKRTKRSRTSTTNSQEPTMAKRIRKNSNKNTTTNDSAAVETTVEIGNDPKRRLSNEERVALIAALENGAPFEDAADQFNLSEDRIHRVVRKRVPSRAAELPNGENKESDAPKKPAAKKKGNRRVRRSEKESEKDTVTGKDQG